MLGIPFVAYLEGRSSGCLFFILGISFVAYFILLKGWSSYCLFFVLGILFVLLGQSPVALVRVFFFLNTQIVMNPYSTT